MTGPPRVWWVLLNRRTGEAQIDTRPGQDIDFNPVSPVVAYLEDGFDRALGCERAGDPEPVRRLAVQSRDRAAAAFEEFLDERGAKPLEPQTAAFLVSAGNHARLAGDVLTPVASDVSDRAGSSAGGARALRAQVQALLAGFLQLADRLAGGADGNDTPVQVSSKALRALTLDCMRRGKDDERAAQGAMPVVIAGEWAQSLARLEMDLVQPVNVAVEAARIRWWR